jgi:hypothetical protein
MVLRDAPRSLPACIGDFVVAKRDPSSVTLLRMQVDGTVRYQGNRAFDDLIYDSAELNAAMEAQGVGCPSELFLHPDDKPNVCRLLSGVLRRLNAAVPDDDAGTYASSEPDVWPLQLVLKGSGLPMMTRAYLRVVTYHGGRMSFWAWRFDPVAAAAPPEPSLETPGAFATRRLGAAAALPQTPPEPDLVSEHSRDAAPVSSGDSGDSLDGAPRFDPVVGLGMGMDDATIEAELRSLGDGAFKTAAATRRRRTVTAPSPSPSRRRCRRRTTTTTARTRRASRRPASSGRRRKPRNRTRGARRRSGGSAGGGGRTR